MASPTDRTNNTVDWDIEFNRPIVDGKIIHPTTGEIIEAGKQGLTNGPPSIDLTLINLNADTGFGIWRTSKPVPVEKLYLAVARHVDEGIYTLESVNVTSYSFVVVCSIQVSQEEFDVAWKNMFFKKVDFKYTDEDWDAYLEKTYGKRI